MRWSFASRVQGCRAPFDNARAGRTAVVVAHRLITVLQPDQVLVIDQGRVVEMETLQELLDPSRPLL